MSWRKLSVAVFLAALAALIRPLPADTVVMRDGRKYVGKITKEIGADWVQFTTRNGKRYTLKREDIARHVKGDQYVPSSVSPAGLEDAGGADSPLITEYKDRLNKIQDPDPKAHFELAEWCARTGLKKTAYKEYEKTLELDKDHAGARKALGYYKIETDGQIQWLEEDEYKLYRLEEKFVSLTDPENLAEVQQKYQKYAKVDFKIDIEEPSRRHGDPATERNLPVRKMLVVQYRIANRTPLTLEFRAPHDVSDRRKWTAVEPGKTCRGEWRAWLYAWREGSKDRPRLVDWEHFARNYSERERIYFRPKGIYFNEPVSLYLALEYSLHGTRWGGHQLLSEEDLKDLVKCEIRASTRLMSEPTRVGPTRDD